MNAAEQSIGVSDIVKLNLKDGDILFVNSNAIDGQALDAHLRRFFPDNIWTIVGVLPMSHQTVADCIATAHKEDSVWT